MVKKARRKPKQSGFKWPTGDGWSFALLAICVISQWITLAITWQLWEVRTEPVHLPILPIPQAPFGLFMAATALAVLIKPKIGAATHAGVFLAACAFDQTRMLPQIWMHILFMAAIAWRPMARFSRWYLAAMWVWAGLHKFISTAWWRVHSISMLALINTEWTWLHSWFAGIVAASELALGLLAIFKPKWAAIACPLLHLGIALFLSPMGANWNYSVIPWNITTAIVGCWLLWNQPEERKRWELYAAAALLIVPAGFYIGWTSPYFAHVLYSGGTPKAMISSPDGASEITGWDVTASPFPQQRRIYAQFFQQTAQVGDKLHIADPRWLLNDLYYEKTEAGVRRLTLDEFDKANSYGVRGSFVDNRESSMALSLTGATMMTRENRGPIYAIEFNAEKFDADSLKHLQGLRNLEQIQLSGTSISDEDLRWLQSLHRLRGLGLNNTSVTEEGLELLKDLPELDVIQYDRND